MTTPPADDKTVQQYWDDVAKRHANDPHSTLPDYHLRGLEARYVLRHLRGEDHVLDIGCGNGATTVLFAEKARSVVGGDYAPAMIEQAKEMHPRDNLTYRVLDVTRLDVPHGTFDAVVTERCLINLPDWPAQQGALRGIAGVLKPGGRLLMCESYEEAFERFAGLRQRHGLPPMKRHWHNCLLREELLRDFLPQLFHVRAVEKMGLYYLISRVVHPLSVLPVEPRYDHPMNALAVRLTLELPPETLAEYSVNGLYVLEKR